MAMGSMLSRAKATVRQWWYPREFRIHASTWPQHAIAALAELARAELAHADAASSPTRGTAPADPPRTGPDGVTGGDSHSDSHSDGLSAQSLADVATSLWRLRGRIARMDDPPRGVVHHLETAWDALTDAGVDIRDHTGEPFDPGLAMSVVAYEPTPGLHREQVIETVRPGIYVGDRSIQMATVIVGTPEPASAPPAQESRTP